MKKSCLLLVLAVVSGVWAGYIDSDGYYVMDEVELSGFKGANGGGAILTMNGANGTISGIQSASNSWWMGFAATNLSVLPTDLTGATGWKLEFENTGAGYLSLILVVSTAANGWQQGSGVGVNPGATGTVFVNITGSDQMQNYFIVASVAATYDVLTFTATTQPDPTDTTITIDGASPIRTIPMTLFGGNLMAWDGAQAGTNTTFNNLLKASGRKYMRVIGGSWSNGHLWSDIEGPNNQYAWKVSYTEFLYLLSQISQPGEEMPPTLQPIVNFPGVWYDVQHTHQEAVNAAVAWVQDQSSRTPTAQYWEIGNEIGGPWEAGYFPEISGTYYGDYFADFVLGMKAVNPNIKIGAVSEPKHELNPYGWYQGYWTYDTLIAAHAKGVVPDFLIIHQYPGSGADASYNPTLLSSDINNIGIYTSNMNGIVANALGPSYVGQIRYWMTEWDSGNGTNDTYRRTDAYVNAMFHAQYILEMAKYNWQGGNAWSQVEYNSSYWPYPVWYVHPLLINYFGRDMVAASSTHPMVRAYASTNANGDMTLFIVNNSPTDSIPAAINISGFEAGTNGQEWFIEPAGSIVAGGVNIQDLNNIKINGVVHPDPQTMASLAPQSFTSGNNFSLTLPPSCMMLMKVPSGTGGNNPPMVSITSPANGATFTAGANVTINATAADSDGTVTKVDFYQGTTLLGTDTTSPYSYTWSNVPAGSYSLTAKATDDDLAVTTSVPVAITVSGLTPPAAPSNLTASAVSTSQINLAWADNSSDESGFRVDRALNSTFTSGLVTSTVGTNVTSFQATGLAKSTKYYFRVRAYNANGESANSNVVNARTKSR